jgi:YfiH family protein
LFYRAESGIWRATPLDAFEWLEHGFGTRQANPDPENLATLHQIHSDLVVRAGGEPGRIGEGDALVTDRPGLRVGVRTADCLPILLVDPERRAIAAVHAGWRGTLLGVAVRAVETMNRLFGSRAGSLWAAIGPGIRGCCYEVGPEVALQFRNIFPERDDLDGKTRLDLAAANRRLLTWVGLSPERIDCGAPCTFCAGREFHSWRRDRESAGRMLSVAGIRA